MAEYVQFMGIKSWAEEDRPREKLLIHGKEALSDAELIAILLGTGSKNETAVDVAKKLLRQATDNLNELGKMSVKELVKSTKGIGQAKAITVLAALELGRRRQSVTAIHREQITGSSDVYAIFSALADLQVEQFHVLFLNRANKVRGRKRISIGGTDGTVADIKIIFQQALEHKASSIILCHNHPSGNLKPSDADINLTRKVKQSGDIMDIKVLDHLIIADTGYYSFADEGMM